MKPQDRLPMARSMAALHRTPAQQGVLTAPWGRHLAALVAGTNEAEITNSGVAYERALERVLDGRLVSRPFPAIENPIVRQFLEDVRCSFREPYPVESLALSMVKYRRLLDQDDPPEDTTP